MLSRDDDVTDHATSKSVTILITSWLNHMFAIQLSLENVLKVFRTFHPEPLITQILNSAEPVDRFDYIFLTFVYDAVYIPPKTLTKTV